MAISLLTPRYGVECGPKIPDILPVTNAETDETGFGGFVTMLTASFSIFGSTVFD